MAYGFCPICGAPGSQRERRPNGNDRCAKGHEYPSASAVSEEGLPHALEFTSIMAGLGDALAHARDVKGPLAIAVCDHSKAEDLAHLIGFTDDPSDQGVRVIPFAASALAYCGRGTRLFRGIVSVPPRPGTAISRDAFDQWIERSIAPYTAPNAPRIVL
jgi:hypothetical protein